MMIEVEDLVKHYGRIAAVNHVSFDVEEGETFGLLGPNGAGKTTIIEILCGLRRFDQGKVKVGGFDLAKDSYKIRSLIGFCPQETLLYDLLNVQENLTFSASLYGLPSSKFKERLEFSSRVLGVGDFLKRRVDALSGGMKRRANLAASIVRDPPIIILDEPTVGFDPNIKREFWELIRRLKSDGGKTVLLSTHDMYEADEICERVAIMEGGKVAALDKPEVLKKTIGGKPKLHIKVKELHAENALKCLGEYHGNVIQGDIQVAAENPWKLMNEITDRLVSNDIYPDRIEIVEPTLEDVFVKLTGKKLVDEGITE